MNILFIILTCKKHLHTRVEWQKQTWLKGVDYVYLDEPVGEETYLNAPKKYVKFFREFDNVDNYDWFFFCDDDTFVYTNKLRSLLENYTDQPTMIGFKGGEFTIYNLRIGWCSGGAGIAMNNALVKKIQTHLQNTEHPLITDETDISLAIWARMSSNVNVIAMNDKFSPGNPQYAQSEGKKDCITYHYCTHEDFITLNQREPKLS